MPHIRKAIAAFLGIGTVSYVMQYYVQPLLIEGKLEMTIPEKLRSKNQKYRAVLYRCVGRSQSDG